MTEPGLSARPENQGPVHDASHRRVPISKIIAEPELWPREQFDAERLQLFADYFAAGEEAKLPPVQLVDVGDGHYLLADGWHRSEVARRSNRDEISAVILAVPAGRDVRQWVLLYAIRAVTQSPVPLTSTERAQVVRRMLAECPSWPDRKIARHVGVSPTTVGHYRELQASSSVQIGHSSGDRPGSVAGTSVDADPTHHEPNESGAPAGSNNRRSRMRPLRTRRPRSEPPQRRSCPSSRAW
jgi:hypothetical protein